MTSHMHELHDMTLFLHNWLIYDTVASTNKIGGYLYQLSNQFSGINFEVNQA